MKDTVEIWKERGSWAGAVMFALLTFLICLFFPFRGVSGIRIIPESPEILFGFLMIAIFFAFAGYGVGRYAGSEFGKHQVKQQQLELKEIEREAKRLERIPRQTFETQPLAGELSRILPDIIYKNTETVLSVGMELDAAEIAAKSREEAILVLAKKYGKTYQEIHENIRKETA